MCWAFDTCETVQLLTGKCMGGRLPGTRSSRRILTAVLFALQTQTFTSYQKAEGSGQPRTDPASTLMGQTVNTEHKTRSEHAMWCKETSTAEQRGGKWWGGGLGNVKKVGPGRDLTQVKADEKTPDSTEEVGKGKRSGRPFAGSQGRTCSACVESTGGGEGQRQAARGPGAEPRPSFRDRRPCPLSLPAAGRATSPHTCQPHSFLSGLPSFWGSCLYPARVPCRMCLWLLGQTQPLGWC